MPKLPGTIYEIRPFHRAKKTPIHEFKARNYEVTFRDEPCENPEEVYRAMDEDILKRLRYDYLAIVGIILLIRKYFGAVQTYTIESPNRCTCAEWSLRSARKGKLFRDILGPSWLATPTRVFNAAQAGESM